VVVAAEQKRCVIVQIQTLFVIETSGTRSSISSGLAWLVTNSRRCIQFFLQLLYKAFKANWDPQLSLSISSPLPESPDDEACECQRDRNDHIDPDLRLDIDLTCCRIDIEEFRAEQSLVHREWFSSILTVIAIEGISLTATNDPGRKIRVTEAILWGWSQYIVHQQSEAQT